MLSLSDFQVTGVGRLVEGVWIMSKTIKTGGGRRRLPSESAAAVRDHAITLDVMVRLQAIALPDASGGFTVVIPALGCATQGDTIEEAQTNAVESTEGWLTSRHKRMKDEAIRATQG